MRYLYIHGFGGNGRGVKATAFREHFGDALMAPSLSTIPELAIDTLEQIVERGMKESPLTLIGSSLGGYYAAYLSEKYGIKAVLINPSVRPYETLERMIGEAFSYYDLSHFEWNSRHIGMLRACDTPCITPDNYLLLLQTGDELLDYTQAQSKFAGAVTVVEEGGNHSFEGIETQFGLIASFAEGTGA